MIRYGLAQMIIGHKGLRAFFLFRVMRVRARLGYRASLRGL